MDKNLLKQFKTYNFINYFKFDIIIITLIIYKIIAYITDKTSNILNKIFYEKTIIGYLHNKITYIYEKLITKLPSIFYYYIISSLGLLSLYNVLIPERLRRISQSTYCTGIKSFMVFFSLLTLRIFSDLYLK